jgi:hypothetical protein
MENGARYVMARIDLPILLRNDGSYDSMNDRAKVSFFSITELPEVQKNTQISLGDLFSQIGESNPHKNPNIYPASGGAGQNTRIRLDETNSEEKKSWFKLHKSPDPNPIIVSSDTDTDISKDEGKNEIDDDYNVDKKEDENIEQKKQEDIPCVEEEEEDETPNHESNTPKPKNDLDASFDQEQEHNVMRILRSEMKPRKHSTKGKTFKNFSKPTHNFTQKSYGL